MFADEASITLKSRQSKGYAPKGQTPISYNSFDVKKSIHLASAVGIDGSLYYEQQDHPYTGENIVQFLRNLKSKIKKNILLIWDGAIIHRCRAVKQYLELESDESQLFLIRQPSYTPEVNADEQVWHYLKCVRLKDQIFKKLKDLKEQVNYQLAWMATQPELIKSFFKHPEVGMLPPRIVKT